MLQDLGMGMTRFQRALKRGLLGIVREEGWATAAGSLFGIVLLAQMFLLFAVGVQGGLDLLRSQTDLRLQVRATATDAQIQDLIQSVRALPSVEDVTYITKEQAYDRQRNADPALIEFITKFGIENPFPDTLGVRLRKLSDFQSFLEFLKQPVFAAVVDAGFLTDTTDQAEQVDRIITAVKAARTVIEFATGLSVLVLLFVLVELIRRRVLMKHDELFIEELIGAARLDVLLPFGIEMAILLFCGLLASLAFCAVLLAIMPFFLPSLSADGMFSPWSQAFSSALSRSLPWILVIELFGVLLLSAVATFIAFSSEKLGGRTHSLH